MTVLLILSVLLNGLFIYLFLSHRQTLKVNTDQLDRITKGYSQMKLRNDSLFKGYDQYVKSTNQVIDELNDTRAYYQKLNEQNQRMITSIAHDFRTPITSIQGYLQLLRDDFEPEKRDYYFDIVQERVESLNELVEEFYMISLLDGDDYELVIENFNPISLVQDRLALYYQELDEQFQTIAVELEERPISIRSSKGDLTRIIDNLIRNAYLHGENYFKVSMNLSLDALVFRFTNQVSGIENIDIHQIFDRLYKADVARSKSSTGLGLAIAKELAEEMNYNLEAETVGEAISFVLTIPFEA